MRKHRGTPSRRDKHVTLAAITPPGVARGRFVGGQQSGLVGCKPPPLFTRGASSCSSQGRHQGNQGAPLQDRVHLPTLPTSSSLIPLPTSCSALPSPLLLPDPEGSASFSLLGAATVSSASAQLPPGSLAFSA